MRRGIAAGLFGATLGVAGVAGGAAATPVDIGSGAPDNVEIRSLDGETLDATDLRVGVGGVGVLVLDRIGSATGPGEVQNTGDTSIGTVLSDSQHGYEPGAGLVVQREGTFSSLSIRVGDGAGAAGSYTVRKNAELIAQVSLEIGANQSHGGLSQTGGSVSAGQIVIASGESSAAVYSISGGSMNGGTAVGTGDDDLPVPVLVNGSSSASIGGPGLGNFVVIGPNPNVKVASYSQNARSILSFVLEPEPPHVSPILVTATALFEDGATLFIERARDPSGTSASGFTFDPADGQAFALMALTTSTSEIQGDVRLDARNVGEWQLVRGPTSLAVRYCPPGNSSPYCQPGFVGPACDDATDNDQDGKLDYPADPGCLDATSDIEDPECDNGMDDDGDGFFDFIAPPLENPDPECEASWWEDESTPLCGVLGVEVLPVLAFAAWRRRRGRRS